MLLAMNRPSKKRTHDLYSREISSDKNIPTSLSLQAYISNAVYGVLIQDDEEIFKIIYKRNWSPTVNEK
jgi:hypothetical protein